MGARQPIGWPDDGRPVVVHGAGKAPATSGASSVFHLHKRVRPPGCAEDINGPPPPRRVAESQWAAFYDLMEPGVGKRVTKAEAIAFAAWGRQHGKGITRRRLDGGMYGVWIKE